MKFELSYQILRLEYHLISYQEFKKIIDNYFLNNSDDDLVNIVSSQTSNEAIFETYRYLNHCIDVKAFQVFIAEIFRSNGNKKLLDRIDELINYFQTPENEEQKITNYLNENKFLKEIYDFFYWSWDELYVTQSGILSDLSDLETKLYHVIQKVQRFKIDNLDNWGNIEVELKRDFKSIIEKRKKIKTTYNNGYK